MSTQSEPPVAGNGAFDAPALQRAMCHRDWLVANEDWVPSEALGRRPDEEGDTSGLRDHAHRLRQGRQIFGVWHQGQRLHPSCQFQAVDGGLVPLLVMNSLLKILPDDESGWTQAFWLFQPTLRLEGARPADVLATRPCDVLVAAHKDFHGDDGI